MAGIRLSYGTILLELTKQLGLPNPKYRSKKSGEFYLGRVAVRLAKNAKYKMVVSLGDHITLKEANQAAAKACIDYIIQKKDIHIDDINAEDVKEAKAEIRHLSKILRRFKNEIKRQLLRRGSSACPD